MQKLKCLIAATMLIVGVSCSETPELENPNPVNTSVDVVYSYFKQINGVYRPSKDEGKMVEFLCDFAKKNGLEYKTDEAGNTLITKPATKNHQNKPTLVLQTHIDMVCVVEPGSSFNFATDAIQTYTKDGWLCSKGTSLGADDGIGVAIVMGILANKELEHPKLEALFTTAEEVGLVGALQLKPGFITGRLILNLDSEQLNNITVGSAGSVDQRGDFDYTLKSTPSGTKFFRINISNCNGGHSANLKSLKNANAIKVLGKFLFDLSSNTTIWMSHISGGEFNNSIPVSSSAIIGIASASEAKFRTAFEEFAQKQTTKYKQSDPKMSINLTEEASPSQVIDTDVVKTLISLINQYPDPIINMMGTSLETSINLGLLTISGDKIKIVSKCRSQSNINLAKIEKQIEDLLKNNNATYSIDTKFASWDPNLESQLLRDMQQIYTRYAGFTPATEITHGGLECGVILDKYPGSDIISIGPDVENPHSINERVNCDSIEKFWKIVLAYISQ